MSRPPAETQPQRTALAWQRTGLGLLGVAGLLASRALLTGRLPALVPAAVVAVLGLAVLGVLAPRRSRATARALAAGRTTSAPGAAGLVTAAVVAAALAAAAELLSAR